MFREKITQSWVDINGDRQTPNVSYVTFQYFSDTKCYNVVVHRSGRRYATKHGQIPWYYITRFKNRLNDLGIYYQETYTDAYNGRKTEEWGYYK